MAAPSHTIVRAWLETLTTGIVELDRDWRALRPPQLTFAGIAQATGTLAPASTLTTVRAFGYFVEDGKIVFALPEAHRSGVESGRDEVYVAGDFNGWQEAVGKEAWKLRLTKIDGEWLLAWTGAAAPFLTPTGQRFKFVTGEHQWLSLPDDAPNGVRDPAGKLNH